VTVGGSRVAAGTAGWRAAQHIADATRILRNHPGVGRPARGDILELVTLSGRIGYVALCGLRVGVSTVETPDGSAPA